MALVYWTVYMSWRYNDATGLFEIGWEVLRTVPETGDSSCRYTLFEYPYEFQDIDITETTLISLSEDDIAKEYLFFFIFADGVRDGPYSWQIRFSQMLDGQFLHNIVHTQFHTVGYPPPPPPPVQPPLPPQPPPIEPPVGPPTERPLEPEKPEPPITPEPPKPIPPDHPPSGRMSIDCHIWNKFIARFGDRITRWGLEVPLDDGDIHELKDIPPQYRAMWQRLTQHKADAVIEFNRVIYVCEIKPRLTLAALGQAYFGWQLFMHRYRVGKLCKPAVICETAPTSLLQIAAQNGITVFVVEEITPSAGVKEWIE